MEKSHSNIRGQPSLYKPELVEKIIDLVYMGKSGIEISRMDGMPSNRTLTNWRRKYPDFAHKWFMAWQMAAWEIEEECLEIADDVSEDYKILYKKNGDPYVVVVKENIARSRLKIHVRLKSMEARMPKVYGREKPVVVTEEPLTREEIDKRLIALTDRARELGS